MKLDSPLTSSDETPALLEALDHGLVRVAGDRVVAANGAFGRMAGLPVDELAGRMLAELFVDPGDRALTVIEAGDGYQLRDLQGRLRPVSLRRVSDTLWLVLDRERESRLEREVWRLASDLGDERERSQQARARSALDDQPLRGEQIGMIEHEIRTAVTAVRGYLRWLGGERDRLLDPEHWSFVREARRAIERVAPLLDNLLELARAGEALPSTRKPLRLHDVLGLALRTARPLLADRGVAVECELDARPDGLCGDPDRLEQVFVNLLANAASHSPEGGRVLVSTDLAELEDGTVVQIAVADQGPGVELADIERIFRPFVQGHGSIGIASGGVGLGLAICRRIVSDHGGHIEAVPDVGHGLFRVTLPSERD
ncbi:MAG: PAS domain-containing sensor histidine kinase [Myxococcota bacterium]